MELEEFHRDFFKMSSPWQRPMGAMRKTNSSSSSASTSLTQGSWKTRIAKFFTIDWHQSGRVWWRPHFLSRRSQSHNFRFQPVVRRPEVQCFRNGRPFQALDRSWKKSLISKFRNALEEF